MPLSTFILDFILVSPCLTVHKLYTSPVTGSNKEFLRNLFKNLINKPYLWLTPQFHSDLLQTLLSRVFNSLEWGLNSPPKPHAFTSLPLQSNVIDLSSELPLGFLICNVMLIISGCFTMHRLYISPIKLSNKGFLKNLFISLKKHPFQFFISLITIITISFFIRSSVFKYLGICRDSVYLCTFISIIFSTWLPVIYTLNILIQLRSWVYESINYVLFVLSDGVIGYEPVFTRMNFSIYNKEFDNVINFKTCFLVLTFSIVGYYFMKILPIIYILSLSGISKVDIISNLPSISFNVYKHIFAGRPLHWNVNLHLSSITGPAPGSDSGSQAAGSGSQAAGSGSQAAGSGSQAAGSGPRAPSYGDLLASTLGATAPPYTWGTSRINTHLTWCCTRFGCCWPHSIPCICFWISSRWYFCTTYAS